MPIPVTCPGCLKRFNVSDKFAGKKGPCPKCKTVIQIPDQSEEVVVHAPDEFGPKGASGESVLKPIEREEVKFSKVSIILGVALAILFPVIAAALRFTGAFAEGGFAEGVFMRRLLLGIGALVLAPGIVLMGYTFLRDEELEGYQGQSLFMRVAICSAIYAALWGLYAYVCHMLGFNSGNHPEMFHLTFLIPLMLIPGALAALATLDLDATMSSVHYGFYLAVCVVLRLIMGLNLF